MDKSEEVSLRQKSVFVIHDDEPGLVSSTVDESVVDEPLKKVFEPIDINSKKLTDAENLIAKAEKLNPESIPVALSRAELEAANGNKAEALKSVRGCLRKDPFNRKALMQYIWTFLRF